MQNQNSTNAGWRIEFTFYSDGIETNFNLKIPKTDGCYHLGFIHPSQIKLSELI
jgi:hypothetical protein